MGNLYRDMAGLLRKRESFSVATIFDKSGSAPRTEGADGSIIGTIGGGRLEAKVIDLARNMIPARKTVIQSFDLTGADAALSDMICGGAGEVLVDFIDAEDDDNLKIYEEAAGILERSEKGWLITAL
jgi:xanthine dehydrogenase accessory factor